MKKYLYLVIVSALLLIGCKPDPKSTTNKPAEEVLKAPTAKIPSSNADRIFGLVEKQLAFGYRVPGTPEHVACKDWFVEVLTPLADKVEVQEFPASFYHVKDAPSYNVIATFNPQHKTRILLAAHWDSRIVAEKDKDEAKKNMPISGADDGASGVAALLEIAQLLKENPIDLGVDIILFDAEDQGLSGGNDLKTWCLGSQYWSSNKHIKGYTAKFGILLDMIGSKTARFGKDSISEQYAGKYQNKIWSLAQRMGQDDLFVNDRFQGIMDDHYYVNTVAHIPMVDIINYQIDKGKFGEYHHTHDDNIDIISKSNLRKVTQLVLAVLYKTSDGSF